MKQEILITTTSSLENISIEKYIGLVSTNVVVGTNFFSDLGASFSDLFGGFSGTYQGKLQKVYSVAIENIRQKAINLRANAVVGLKIDFDEISGKGKSMFMVSVVGTAVKVLYTHPNRDILGTDMDINVQVEDLRNEITRRNIIKTLEEGLCPSENQLQYLSTSHDDQILPLLLSQYLKKWDKEDAFLNANEKVLQNSISRYFRQIDRDKAICIIYPMLITHSIPIMDILADNSLFSPKEITSLIKEKQLTYAINCLSLDMEFYTKEDLINMYEILETLESLPDTGELKIVKGVLSKAKEKYVCVDKHTNGSEFEYCDTCGKNIKGLSIIQIRKINAFKEKVDALKLLLTK